MLPHARLNVRVPIQAQQGGIVISNLHPPLEPTRMGSSAAVLTGQLLSAALFHKSGHATIHLCWLQHGANLVSPRLETRFAEAAPVLVGPTRSYPRRPGSRTRASENLSRASFRLPRNDQSASAQNFHRSRGQLARMQAAISAVPCAQARTSSAGFGRRTLSVAPVARASRGNTRVRVDDATVQRQLSSGDASVSHRQVAAAIPVRRSSWGPLSRVEVLMISSRDGSGFVFPKVRIRSG